MIEGYFSNVQNYPTIIFRDKISTIYFSKNHVFRKKRKNINTRFYFIRELVNDGYVLLDFGGSQDQLADIFTKTLGKYVF